MSDTAIRVESLSKRYGVGAVQARHDTLRDQVADMVAALLRRLSSLARRTRREGGLPLPAADGFGPSKASLSK